MCLMKLTYLSPNFRENMHDFCPVFPETQKLGSIRFQEQYAWPKVNKSLKVCYSYSLTDLIWQVTHHIALGSVNEYSVNY